MHRRRNYRFEDYMCTHINAQKILGPPKTWVGNPPGEYTEVFISNLPKSIELKDMYALASTVGELYMARLPITYTEAKGYAFMRFSTSEEAASAIRRLNGTDVLGRQISVKLSRDSCHVIIRPWPQHWNRNKSLKELQKCLNENVVDVKLYPEVDNPDLNMPFVVARFGSHDDAARARRDVKHGALAPVTGRTHECEDVRQDNEIPEEDFNNILQLHFAGIPIGTDLNQLKNAMRSCLAVEEIKRIKFKLNPNGFAFALFESHAVAEEAAIKMRGKGVVIQDVKLRIQWMKGEYSKTKQTRQDNLNFGMASTQPPCHGKVTNRPAHNRPSATITSLKNPQDVLLGSILHQPHTPTTIKEFMDRMGPYAVATVEAEALSHADRVLLARRQGALHHQTANRDIEPGAAVTLTSLPPAGVINKMGMRQYALPDVEAELLDHTNRVLLERRQGAFHHLAANRDIEPGAAVNLSSLPPAGVMSRMRQRQYVLPAVEAEIRDHADRVLLERRQDSFQHLATNRDYEPGTAMNSRSPAAVMNRMGQMQYVLPTVESGTLDYADRVFHILSDNRDNEHGAAVNLSSLSPAVVNNNLTSVMPQCRSCSSSSTSPEQMDVVGQQYFVSSPSTQSWRQASNDQGNAARVHYEKKAEFNHLSDSNPPLGGFIGATAAWNFEPDVPRAYVASPGTNSARVATENVASRTYASVPGHTNNVSSQTSSGLNTAEDGTEDIGSMLARIWRRTPNSNNRPDKDRESQDSGLPTSEDFASSYNLWN